MAKRVRVGELDVSYGEAGEGGRPFVLVHGFSGSHDDFADVLAPLARRRRTLAPDQRGHGGTSNPGRGYSLDQLRVDLASFLDAVGVDQCDLLGHSMGGMVALRLALAEPRRIASLVLMDTTARGVSPLSPRTMRLVGKVLRRTPPRMLWHLVRANRRRLPPPMRRAEQAMGPERYWERLRVKLEALDPAVHDVLLRELVEQVPVTDRLAEIRCPTLVVVGEQDEGLRAPSDELAAGIPDAKLVVVPDAHHSPQIEATEAWLEAIEGHLADARRV